MNTTLTVDNVWCVPTGNLRQVKEALTFKAKGFFHSRAYKAGYWNGDVCLLQTLHKSGRPALGESAENTYRFAAGLVEYVRDYLVARDYEVTIHKPKEPRGIDLPYHYAQHVQVDLNEAQYNAIEQAEAHNRGILQAPTGAGKGRIIGEIIRSSQRRALVLCDKADLMTQLAAELAPVVGVPVGTIGGGSGWKTRPNVNVATVQTIDSGLKNRSSDFIRLLEGIEVVCVDECHHLSSDQYARVMAAMPNAYWRYGFSATPFRNGGGGEDLKVIGWTGPVISSQTTGAAVESGRLVPADIFIIHGLGRPDAPEDPCLCGHARANHKLLQNVINRKGCKVCPCTYYNEAINYHEATIQRVAQNEARNLAISELLQTRNASTIVLVERVEHGLELERLTGVPFIHGGSLKVDRTNAWDCFRSGAQQSLIVSKIGREGLNLPNIEVLILAGAGKAPHLSIQAVGRGLRASNGKARLQVFDFMDEGKYLDSHYKRRRKTYEADAAYTCADVTWTELQGWLQGWK